MLHNLIQARITAIISLESSCQMWPFPDQSAEPVLGDSVAIDGLSLSASESVPLPIARLPGSLMCFTCLSKPAFYGRSAGPVLGNLRAASCLSLDAKDGSGNVHCTLAKSPGIL